jgi:hypothetical protein
MRLLDIIDSLDIKAESVPLSESKRICKKEANECLLSLRRDEEAKWAQRAKGKYIQEEGDNTKYFHLIANGKHRKKKIFQLEQDEGTIIGEENLRVFISEYYKGLFGAPPQNHFTLLKDRIQDIPQLAPKEKDLLSADFTESKVEEAVMQMKKNKAPGPDGFPAEFYQVFWDTIKDDMMAMFYQLQARDLPLFRLNFGIITLLPKKEDASHIKQYRPICLLNVSFKIFTKVGANCITRMAQKIIKPTQTAFIPGRNILEGVVVLHETIHELHSKKLDGVLFKIDFEKAYDKVKWPFLHQVLRMKGFPVK